MSGTTPYRPLELDESEGVNGDGKLQKARVLYDYDAKDITELSLMADEIVLVEEMPNKADEDYYLGKRGQQTGKVPKAFIEVIL